MQKLFFFIIGLFVSVALYCQESDTTAIIDTLDVSVDIFEPTEPMDFTIEFNIKEYQKEKYKGEYMPAKLTYHINDTLDVTKKIRLKARGQFRRQHCSLPPFWLNIRKADIKNENLEETKKIKVVTHCKGSNAYNEYVLKEYLAYKIYNIISLYSFRVRLIRLNYIDTGRKNKQYSSWAFMIEPEEMMAERLNTFSLKNDKLGHKHTDTLATDIMTIFQYMVGNADYSVTGRHNVKLLKIKDFSKPYPIPVPYDFDYSGLVNTYYALPGEELGIESVTERYFMGVCRTDEQYQKALDLFRSKKDEVFSLINSNQYLDDKSKEEMISYLNEFYDSIELSGFTKRSFKNTCR